MATMDEEKIKVYPEVQAKLLFKELRKRGFKVDLGKNTGNIYSTGGRKLTWMVRDLQHNWIIEKLF